MLQWHKIGVLIILFGVFGFTGFIHAETSTADILAEDLLNVLVSKPDNNPAQQGNISQNNPIVQQNLIIEEKPKENLSTIEVEEDDIDISLAIAMFSFISLLALLIMDFGLVIGVTIFSCTIFGLLFLYSYDFLASLALAVMCWIICMLMFLFDGGSGGSGGGGGSGGYSGGGGGSGGGGASGSW